MKTISLFILISTFSAISLAGNRFESLPCNEVAAKLQEMSVANESLINEEASYLGIASTYLTDTAAKLKSNAKVTDVVADMEHNSGSFSEMSTVESLKNKSRTEVERDLIGRVVECTQIKSR